MKAAKGIKKTRLEPDGDHAATVTQIAQWRYYEQCGYDTIADRLNADPVQYPPPSPPGGRRARGAWSKTSVADVLKNPKYTGYQVFNRRASHSRGGKHNDPELWVWSPEPAHEPLIPKWMFDEITARRHGRRGSRDGDTVNAHPLTERTYVLRGMVLCMCGRSMTGNVRHGSTYYLCWPRNNNRGRMDRFVDHPKANYVREDAILDAVHTFYSGRLFGSERGELLAAQIAAADDRTATQRAAEREALQRGVADVARRQSNLMRQAQDQDDPHDAYAQGLRDAYNELQAEKAAALAALAALDEIEGTTPHPPTADEAALLEGLPFLAANLAQLPSELQRRLFDLTRLAVRLEPDGDHVTITASLVTDQLDNISDTIAMINSLGAANSQFAAPTSTNAPVWMHNVPPVRFERTLDGF